MQKRMRNYQVLDLSGQVLRDDAMLPFAYDEWQCRQVGIGEAPTVHLWVHRHAMILGLRDRKLPFAGEVMHALEKEGQAVIVRHSGGAAVPLDSGVLNVSLIYPKPTGHIEINDDFEWMKRLIAQTVDRLVTVSEHGKDKARYSVKSGEVIGSYCPGKYDLSIDGLKFCGIAQRRQTKATVVQAFLNVLGSGKARAHSVRAFYEAASRGEAEAGSYPIIQENRTTSLQEAVGITSMQQFVQALKQTLIVLAGEPSRTLTDYEAPAGTLEAMAATLRDRYDR